MPRGRIVANEFLQVPEWPGCGGRRLCAGADSLNRVSFIHRLRSTHAAGRGAARNLVAAVEGRPPEPFKFKMIGSLAAIGRRAGVAEIYGLKFSGILAWWLWRGIYLSKLPGFQKKVRVMLDWTLDLLSRKRSFSCLPPLTNRYRQQRFPQRPVRTDCRIGWNERTANRDSFGRSAGPALCYGLVEKSVVKIEVLAGARWTWLSQAATIIASDARAPLLRVANLFSPSAADARTWQMLRDLAGEDIPWKNVHVVQVDERVAPR